MPSGGILTHDWPSLYAEFLTAKQDKPKLELEAFCKERQLNYTNTSRNFALRARLIAGDKLAMLAPRASQKLGEMIDNEDANLSLKSSTAILDRAGLSPQAMTINVQANAQANNVVNLAPFFKASNGDQAFADLLLGDESGDEHALGSASVSPD